MQKTERRRGNVKRLILFLMLLMLCAASAQAAEWPEGRSPAKPYEGVPEVDLSDTMGYIMLAPRGKVPAEHFCDRLEMYLPREDVNQGGGSLRLYAAADGQLVEEISFQDPRAVIRRPLTEEELQGLMWGGGVCFEVRLSASLKLNAGYYVDMDEACIVVEGGGPVSPPVHAKDAWTPVAAGDYGVSELRRQRPAPEEGAEAAAETESADAQAPAQAAGDTFSFDLVLGGEAASAVIYSDNDSVDIAEREYTESGPVAGTLLSDQARWGVVFLNADHEPLVLVDCSR